MVSVSTDVLAMVSVSRDVLAMVSATISVVKVFTNYTKRTSV